MECVFTKLAKCVLLKLGLSAGMSVADGTIQKKIYGSGSTALIISNKKKGKYIMKIVKSREESALLTEGVSETIKN